MRERHTILSLCSFTMLDELLWLLAYSRSWGTEFLHRNFKTNAKYEPEVPRWLSKLLIEQHPIYLLSFSMGFNGANNSVPVPVNTSDTGKLTMCISVPINYHWFMFFLLCIFAHWNSILKYELLIHVFC